MSTGDLLLIPDEYLLQPVFDRIYLFKYLTDLRLKTDHMKSVVYWPFMDSFATENIDIVSTRPC